MEQQKRMLTGFNAKTKITPEEKEQMRGRLQELEQQNYLNALKDDTQFRAMLLQAMASLEKTIREVSSESESE
jgi:hypothetical protein